MRTSLILLFLFSVASVFSQTLIATSMHPQATANHNQRKIVRDTADNVYVVYQDSLEEQTGVYGVWFNRVEEVWSEPFLISRGKNPTLSISKENKIFLVYESDSTISSINYRSTDDFLSWSDELVISQSSFNCWIPVADVDSSSNLNVFWLQAWDVPVFAKINADTLLSRNIINIYPVNDIAIANHLRYEDDTLFYAFDIDDYYLSVNKSDGFTLLYEEICCVLGAHSPCLTYNYNYYSSVDDYYYRTNLRLLCLNEDSKLYCIKPLNNYMAEDRYLMRPEAMDYICVDNMAKPTGFSYLFCTNNNLYHGFSYGHNDWFSVWPHTYYDYDVVMDTVSTNPIYPSIAYKQFRFHVVDYIWMEETDSCYNICHKRDDKYDPLNAVATYQNGVELSGYPNPFKDKITVTFSVKDFSEPVELEIYNSLGMLVNKLSPVESINGTYSYEWDGLLNNGDYAQPGTYVVVCSTKNQKLAGKIFYLGK